MLERVPVEGKFINVNAVVAVAKITLKLFPVLQFITYEELEDVPKFTVS
jgi:hypothetical protein